MRAYRWEEIMQIVFLLQFTRHMEFYLTRFMRDCGLSKTNFYFAKQTEKKLANFI